MNSAKGGGESFEVGEAGGVSNPEEDPTSTVEEVTEKSEVMTCSQSSAVSIRIVILVS